MRMRIVLEALTLAALIALIWMTWPINRAVLARPASPVPSGVRLESTVRYEGREPVKITLDLHVGETAEQWEQRLHEALERAKDFQ